MVHFTFKNGLAGKSLSVHNSFKSFIIMVVMLVLTTSSAFAEEIDGLNYKLDSETKTAILIPKTNGKYAGDIVVPGKIKGTDGAEYSVVTLGAECFSACYNLSSITIPSTVTVIGVRCFKECGSLTSIVIPSSVSSLGEGCFKNCSSLTSINIPSSVTSLGYECFYGCSSLVSIIIPSSVTSLDWSCFWDCKSLTSITIPPSVTSLSKACFYGCSSLTSITIPASVTSIGSLCFAYCSSLTSITIPASVKWIGEYRTHLPYGMNFYLIFLMVETMIVVFRDDNVLESQFFCLSNTLLDAAHRTDFTAQTYLACHTPTLLYRRVNITAQYGCQHTQVHGRIGDSQSTGNIQEHILLHQFEPHTFLQNRQEHVQTALVKTRCRTLRSSIDRKSTRLNSSHTDISRMPSSA